VAIVRVQSATPTTSTVSGTTLTIQFAGNTVVGNHAIVVVGHSGALGLTSAVTDGAGNTWNADVNTNDGNATGAYSSIHSCKITNQILSSTVITVTISGSVSQRGMVAYEYSGLDTTTWLDQVSNTGKGTSTTPASGSITTTATGLILGACCYNATPVSHAATASGFTEIADFTFTKSLAVDENNGAVAGTYSDTGTLGSSVLWSNSIASYKAAVPLIPNPRQIQAVLQGVNRSATY